MPLYDTPVGQTDAAYKLLLEQGWCQGSYRQGTAYSLVAALGAVSAGPLTPVLANGRPVTVYDQETKKQVPLSNRPCCLNENPLWVTLCEILDVPLVSGLQEWNDRPTTTLLHIQILLDDAVRLIYGTFS